jgi:hypothetical protein
LIADRTERPGFAANDGNVRPPPCVKRVKHIGDDIMVTKSNSTTQNRISRRSRVLNRIKREATTSRLATAAGVMAIGAAAFALLRDGSRRAQIKEFGRSIADKAQAMADNSAKRKAPPVPLAAVA